MFRQTGGGAGLSVGGRPTRLFLLIAVQRQLVRRRQMLNQIPTVRKFRRTRKALQLQRLPVYKGNRQKINTTKSALTSLEERAGLFSMLHELNDVRGDKATLTTNQSVRRLG